MLRTAKGPFVLRCIAASGRASERTTWARSRFDGGNAMAINKRSVTALCLLLLLLRELRSTYSVCHIQHSAHGARSSKPALAHFQRCLISRYRQPLAALTHLSKGTQHLTAVVAGKTAIARAQAKLIGHILVINWSYNDSYIMLLYHNDDMIASRGLPLGRRT